MAVTIDIGAGITIPTYTHGEAITRNDSADLPHAARAIFVGGAGTIKVDMLNGESGVTFDSNSFAGAVLPIAVTKVYLTGTSATNLVALW